MVDLVQLIEERLAPHYEGLLLDSDMPTLEVMPEKLIEVATVLKTELMFTQLSDICGVDYQDYGVPEWRTQETTESGFSRGVDDRHDRQVIRWDKPRFAVVYHLLSMTHNARIRVRVFLGEQLVAPSVVGIWTVANWFEREAYDMFGIAFDGHPDLRRILSDYGFKGHPLRKDFPMNGEVELRYDAALQRCVYEPVSIQPKVTVPKVIRRDDRYIEE